MGNYLNEFIISLRKLGPECRWQRREGLREVSIHIHIYILVPVTNLCFSISWNIYASLVRKFQYNNFNTSRAFVISHANYLLADIFEYTARYELYNNLII